MAGVMLWSGEQDEGTGGGKVVMRRGGKRSGNIQNGRIVSIIIEDRVAVQKSALGVFERSKKQRCAVHDLLPHKKSAQSGFFRFPGDALTFDKVCGGGADLCNLGSGDGGRLVAPRRADVGEYGGELIIRQRGSLRRHFQIINLAQYFDRAFQAVERDLDRAVGGAILPWAACQRRECTAGRAPAVGTMTGRTIEGEKLPAVLGGQ